MGSFGLRCVSILPFFILVTKFADWSCRTSRVDLFFLSNRLGMKTHNRGGGWLSNQTKSYTLPTIFSTRGSRVEPFVLRGSSITRSLRYRCSETCLSSRLITMGKTSNRWSRSQNFLSKRSKPTAPVLMKDAARRYRSYERAWSRINCGWDTSQTSTTESTRLQSKGQI